MMSDIEREFHDDETTMIEAPLETTGEPQSELASQTPPPIEDDVIDVADEGAETVDATSEAPAPAKKDNRNWFVIHTY
jgi:hypothetical protein